MVLLVAIAPQIPTHEVLGSINAKYNIVFCVDCTTFNYSEVVYNIGAWIHLDEVLHYLMCK